MQEQEHMLSVEREGGKGERGRCCRLQGEIEVVVGQVHGTCLVEWIGSLSCHEFEGCGACGR